MIVIEALMVPWVPELTEGVHTDYAHDTVAIVGYPAHTVVTTAEQA